MKLVWAATRIEDGLVGRVLDGRPRWYHRVQLLRGWEWRQYALVGVRQAAEITRPVVEDGMTYSVVEGVRVS